MKYKYRLHNTGESSKKFGPCEVCGKHVSEAYFQVEEHSYSGGWTQHKCHSYFGHKECLLTKRR